MSCMCDLQSPLQAHHDLVSISHLQVIVHLQAIVLVPCLTNQQSTYHASSPIWRIGLETCGSMGEESPMMALFFNINALRRPAR